MDLDDPTIRSHAKDAVSWIVVGRLCGDLGVSRALGDCCFKVLPVPLDSRSVPLSLTLALGTTAAYPGQAQGDIRLVLAKGPPQDV